MTAERIETRPVLSRKAWLVWLGLTGLLLGALGLFGAYWVSVPDWRTYPLAFAGMSIFLLLFIAQFVQSWTGLPLMRRPVPPAPPEGLRVAMITTFVPGAEPLDMLEATLRAMTLVRYPHVCWVLDEGDDAAVKALCARLGVRHYSRKGRAGLNTAEGPLKARTKYGNINAWLQEVGYEAYDVVSAFDPDHVPAADFLERTLGYFRDAGVGFVQAAQVYYNQEAGFIAAGAAEETYAYYSSTLMSGFGMGYVVVVGCHNTHRVRALKEAGGFAPHDADDLLIAIHYMEKGWRGIYVPETLAVGLTQIDWPTYLTQQRRWARSVFDIKVRILPRLWGRLPARIWTLAFLQGISYFIDIFLPILGAGLLCFILLDGEVPIVSRLLGGEFLLLILAFAGIDLFRQSYFLNPGPEQGLHWRAGLLRAAKWPYVGLGLLDVLGGRRGLYEITSKVGGGRRAWPMLLPQALLALAVLAAYGYALAFGQIPYWALHFWAIFIGLGGLGVFATAFLPPPRAFDRELLARRWRSFVEPTREADASALPPSAVPSASDYA